MIKIRYSELRAGLHVQVERRGPSTIIYLLPGLTLGQRRAALLRARRSASMGYGPRLPVTGLAAALVRDRVRVTVRNGTAAFRAHPILLLPMAVVLSASMVYVAGTAVTMRMHSPQDGGSLPGLTSGRGGHHDPSGPRVYLSRLGGEPVGEQPGARPAGHFPKADPVAAPDAEPGPA